MISQRKRAIFIDFCLMTVLLWSSLSVRSREDDNRMFGISYLTCFSLYHHSVIWKLLRCSQLVMEFGPRGRCKPFIKIMSYGESMTLSENVTAIKISKANIPIMQSMYVHPSQRLQKISLGQEKRTHVWDVDRSLAVLADMIPHN